ncbi:hypothetical protein ACQRIU_006822 [Beauveria bassiana]
MKLTLITALATVAPFCAAAATQTPSYQHLPFSPGASRPPGEMISQREYAKDTVFWSLTPNSFSARRRTTMLFFAPPSSSAPPLTTTPSLPAHLVHLCRQHAATMGTTCDGLLARHVPARASPSTHTQRLRFASGPCTPRGAGGRAARAGRCVGWRTGLCLDAAPMLAVEETSFGPSSQKGGFNERVVVTPGKDDAAGTWSGGWMDARADSEPSTTRRWFPPERDGHQAGYALGSGGISLTLLYPGQTSHDDDDDDDDVPQSFRDGLCKT